MTSFIIPISLLMSHHGLTIACFSEINYFNSSALLKIMKNRLRTSLSDDKLTSLLMLAPEKDLMMQLTADDIINRLAYSRPSWKSYLMY